AVLFPKTRVAPLRIKERGVEAAREDFDALRGDAAVDPRAAIALAVHVEEVELVVEPLHEIPRERLQEIVVGEDADVLREVGVINATGAQAEDLAGEQRGQ